MLIKNAMKKDIPDISKLMLEEFKKPPFNEKTSINTVLKSVSFYFKIGKIFVAIADKEIVGVLVFKIEQYWEGTIIIIEDLVVKERFRRKKIGEMLMNNMEAYAKNKGLKKVILKTDRKAIAVKFYQKCGYKVKNDIIHFEKKIN